MSPTEIDQKVEKIQENNRDYSSLNNIVLGMSVRQKISAITVLGLFFYAPLRSMDSQAINLQDELGYTLLHRTTSLEEAIKLLMQGADANIQNQYGDTGCHAIMRMSFDKSTVTTKTILELLVENADFGIQNNIGNTPFHSLVRCGNMSICSSLIKCMQNRQMELFYAMQATKILLLIHFRKRKFKWLPKNILFEIIHIVLSNNELSVCREKYARLNLNPILMKKNKQKKRVENLVACRYSNALGELNNLKKHKKKYSGLYYKNIFSEQQAYVNAIKETQKLLNPDQYT